MKILHTSDWHLGAADGEYSLLEDQKFFLDEICRVVREKSVKAVIVAGDVYDRPIAPAEAIRLYDDVMTRLCRDFHTEVIVIAGNHDSAERLSSCSALLSASGLHIAGALEREPAKVSVENADIYLLPWITEEKVKSVFPQEKEKISSLEDAYRVVTGQIRRSMDKSKRNILAAHAFIANCETSVSDRAAEIGFASQVSAGVFDGFDYVALGHIHKPQNVTGTIRYSGTPMPYSFGREEKQEKSVTIIDTDDMSTEIVPLPLLHKRTTLRGTLVELLRPAVDEETRNGYVRLQTEDYVGSGALSELKILYPRLGEIFSKTFTGESSSVTMTLEELEKLESNPVEVFLRFCREEIKTEADEHLISLFKKAIEIAEEKAQ